ncbi:hypothetical protein QWI29_21885 [Mycolicibacterium neoaurum]|uniref:hypothetical protein n=1 Tax=Mycolicibacterium neoaurum TaxID=1795 RepID=UPI0026719911|nr:hypothetical protein [Mycolicibacterium neoaurum]MDO3402701.1 hypothetical protein [Mycolicibacterium neoaurum]
MNTAWLPNCSSKLLQQIQAAYDHDHGPADAPVAVGDNPLTFESITDDLLTHLLCRGVDGAQVVTHRLGPVDDASWNHRRITLPYNEAGMQARLLLSVFGKASQSLKNRMVLGISGAAQCEVTFYREFRDLLDINLPRVNGQVEVSAGGQMKVSHPVR